MEAAPRCTENYLLLSSCEQKKTVLSLVEQREDKERVGADHSQSYTPGKIRKAQEHLLGKEINRKRHRTTEAQTIQLSVTHTTLSSSDSPEIKVFHVESPARLLQGARHTTQGSAEMRGTTETEATCRKGNFSGHPGGQEKFAGNTAGLGHC